MIHHSFIHIPGIGHKTEMRLWEQGITTLEELAGMFETDIEPEYDGESGQYTRSLKIMEDSQRALAEEDWLYFYKILPSKEQWRLLPCFKKPAFLDIETTGLGFFNNHITIIGIYDTNTAYSYVYGRNLDDFTKDISEMCFKTCWINASTTDH